MDPLVADLPPPAPISKKTLTITGLLVDVYGLEELAATANYVSCLWLHNPRKSNKERMGDIAQRAVGAWNSRVASGLDTERGLIALAFDQRNHGSRQVHEEANGSWREGNETHAQDMLGVIAGAVVDQSLLIDSVGSYLFLEGPKRTIDHHLALGVSVGGHSVWQSMFAESRLVAGAVIIGCPDLIYLLTDRARLSRRSTYSAADNGASFLGSKDFPNPLIAATCKLDPKALMFGIRPVSSQPADCDKVKHLLMERIRGKRFLLASGADDKVVPYRCSQHFTDWLVAASKGWCIDGRFSVENNIYPGVGHVFSLGMIQDSLRFITDAVAAASSGMTEVKGAKI